MDTASLKKTWLAAISFTDEFHSSTNRDYLSGFGCCLFALLAQWLEHWSYEPRVHSSILWWSKAHIEWSKAPIGWSIAALAEWSKAPDLRPGIYGFVGSNPTGSKIYDTLG